jgi:uncharacterized protein (DUF952 family)
MTIAVATLVHICGRREWAAASSSGELRPASLSDHGFVHLSPVEQVHWPANRLYAGRTDLVLLYLNADRLGAPIRWERGVPTDPAAMLFPHLYGPLPVEAVIAVTPYLPKPDGSFPVLSQT